MNNQKSCIIPCDEVIILANKMPKIENKLDRVLEILEGTQTDPGGIIKDIKANSEFRVISETRHKVYMGAVGSGWLLTIILLVLQFVA